MTLPRQNLFFQMHHIALLKEPAPMFLPCENISLTDNHAVLTYSRGDYQPFADMLQNRTLAEKYQILLHIGRYFSAEPRQYHTYFTPQNIVLDQSFDTAFMLRILPDMTTSVYTIQKEFEDYKALVLSVVSNKHTYDQLIQYGLDVADQNPLCAQILSAQTPESLKEILKYEHNKTYTDARDNRISFRKRTVKTVTLITAFLMATLIAALGWFAYDNITKTRNYGVKTYIYDSYYSRDPQAVVNWSKRLKDSDMDTNLKRVIADALIATNEPENLQRAFTLDSTRQIEVIEKLILLQQDSIIATLTSDNHLAQLYIAHYAKDYPKAITLFDTHTDLKYNAQAQLLISQTYAATGDFTTAQNILSDLGDTDALIGMYKQHKEHVMKTETNPERRQQMADYLDGIVKVLEDIKKAKQE
jgi:uncharacterized membrane protein YukC